VAESAKINTSLFVLGKVIAALNTQDVRMLLHVSLLIRVMVVLYHRYCPIASCKCTGRHNVLNTADALVLLNLYVVTVTHPLSGQQANSPAARLVRRHQLRSADLQCGSGTAISALHRTNAGVWCDVSKR